MESRPFRLVTGDAAIDGVLHPAGRPGKRPAVVICHGFKGFMDWGFFPPLAQLLAERGFAVVRFNYSGTGQRPGEDRVSDLEAFRRNTFSRELDETLRVIAAVGSEVGAEVADGECIGLVGHSRGGGMALLAAAHEAARERVKALVTWAAVATFDRFDDAAKALWRERGELLIENARTGQQLALGLELLEDLERNRRRLDLTAAATRRTAPWLIVHGSDDETVPVAEARRLKAHASGVVELLEIPGANHTFGAQHPFAGPTPHLIQAMNATQTWLRRHLPAA
ncbi:MAG: alpha/beta fold hydrolase [Acidobacteria bacterium]|nr:MAG: alpha/beta fold hydrolase [Acidobacteriota bacterium]